jgi:hypothetical protein
MKIVAGVGTRKLDQINPARREAYIGLLKEYCEEGYYLHSGGAEGADHEATRIFMEDTIDQLRCTLFLPWDNYNEALLTKWAGNFNRVVYDASRDTEAAGSVDIYHPSPQNLKAGARKLLARNYLIVVNADVVIAVPDLPYRGGPTANLPGGTFQAIRIAQDLGKKITIL